MRERITIAFVVLAMAVLLGAGTVRAYTLRDLLREQEGAHLSHDVVLIGELVANQRAAGQPVDEEFLEGVVADDDPARVRRPVRARRSSSRATSTPGDPEADDLSATASHRRRHDHREQATQGGRRHPRPRHRLAGHAVPADRRCSPASPAGSRPARCPQPVPAAGRRRAGARSRPVRPGPAQDADARGAWRSARRCRPARTQLEIAAQPGARLRRARLPRAEDPADVAAPRARGAHPARRRTRRREGGRDPLHPQRRRR